MPRKTFVSRTKLSPGNFPTFARLTTSFNCLSSRDARIPACLIVLLQIFLCLPLFAQCTNEIHDGLEPSLSRRIPPTGLPVTEDFQALIDHSPGTWPTVPVHTLRLWDTGTAWFQINPGQGVYDWGELDR